MENERPDDDDYHDDYLDDYHDDYDDDYHADYFDANHRYLVVFGHNGNIAVLDTQTIEWYLSKYKLPVNGNVNSLMDENGFLYLLSPKTFSRYYVVSVEQFKIEIDAMIDRNDELDDIAMHLFKNAWLHRRNDRYFDWKHICDEKLTDFRRLFDKHIAKSSSSSQTALVILWEMVKGDVDAMPVISKLIRPHDLMKNIHALFDHRSWQLSDIHLFKMWIDYLKLDEDTLFIDFILKYDDYKTLEYAIENDIYSLDQCIEFIVSDGCKYDSTKCHELLHNMIVNEKQNSITYKKLQCAILHDRDDVLEILLTMMLKAQGIENIQSYRENEIVTFEFVFNLLKLCIKNGITAQCAGLLKRWLQVIIKHQLQYESSRINNNTKDLACILCLKPIATIRNIGTNYNGYDCCACHDYQKKRV